MYREGVHIYVAKLKIEREKIDMVIDALKGLAEMEYGVVGSAAGVFEFFGLPSDLKRDFSGNLFLSGWGKNSIDENRFDAFMSVMNGVLSRDSMLLVNNWDEERGWMITFADGEYFCSPLSNFFTDMATLPELLILEDNIPKAFQTMCLLPLPMETSSRGF